MSGRWRSATPSCRSCRHRPPGAGGTSPCTMSPELNRVEERGYMSRRVVVTGLGAVTPLGNTAKATWDGFVNGRNGVAPVTLFDASDLEIRHAAEVKDF